MGCRRYGGSMIEQVRRRMMMRAKPYDAEVEWVELNGKGLIMTQTPSQYTVWFKIMVITRDASIEYPNYLMGSGSYKGVNGEHRWIFGYDNVKIKNWYIESYNYFKYYNSYTIVKKVYEPPYPLYVKSEYTTLYIGTTNCKMRFYELRASTLQNEPWLHLKIVRKGNEAFFYDDVSSTMYNIQCDYIIGPDKTA